MARFSSAALYFGADEYFRDMRIIGSGARIALPAGRIALS
jgi:hypothetical protein